MQTITPELEQVVLENSDYVAALYRVYDAAKSIVYGAPCHAHDKRPCDVCLVGNDDRSELGDAVKEFELLS